MEQTKQERVQALTNQLNRYRSEYYNLNAPTVTDEVYDRLYDELAALERETGICMANSPTRTVGYPSVSTLEKTIHTTPLLSMDKTKRVEELMSFMGEQLILLMLKLDGLTVKLTYEDGQLVQAATRGDGNEGEIITHNARGISGIPQEIPYKNRLVVTGEAFIRPSDFEVLRGTLIDSTGKPYKNGRNLAAGSVRLLDAAACRERRVTFMPFNVLEGFEEYEYKAQRLRSLTPLGFQVCKFLASQRPLKQEEVDGGIRQLQKFAKDNDIPIDGIVVTFNRVAYARSCGRTEHHYKDGLAFKFEDDLFETKLRSIEWTPTRSGEIAPVAVFDTVEIDGCEVSRASLHNLSFIEGLELMPDNRVLVSKRNMIIPHIEENLDRGGFQMDCVVPHRCPCCGQPTRIHENDGTKTLFCDNPHCETRRLRQFVHFASQKAMDIEGLSESTLEKLIGRGWLHSYMDIYQLDKHRDAIVAMDGFGEKSWARLWEAIQNSRNTTFERFLIAMDIPMIGNTASRALCQKFHGSLAAFENAVLQHYDFAQLPDFGETLSCNIAQWFEDEEHWYLWEGLQAVVMLQAPAPVPETTKDNPFVGLTIVVTGKVEPYTRTGINAKIESLGAHAGSSVSSKTDFLVCGENAGSKLDKARQLGVKVLTPAEFFRMAGV
jgi:DNA ligase (NAD+)